MDSPFRNMKTIAQRTQEMKVKEDSSYNEFISQPQVKLLMSMIPESSPPETLTVLLRQTFEAGYGKGQIDMAGEMVEIMMRDIKPRGAGL